MNNYVKYEHGETGIILGVTFEMKHGNVDVSEVFLKGINIINLISDEIIIDMQLFLENYSQEQ